MILDTGWKRRISHLQPAQVEVLQRPVHAGFGLVNELDLLGGRVRCENSSVHERSFDYGPLLVVPAVGRDEYDCGRGRELLPDMATTLHEVVSS